MTKENELPWPEIECPICEGKLELADAQAWDCGQANSECSYCDDGLSAILKPNQAKAGYEGANYFLQCHYNRILKTDDEYKEEYLAAILLLKEFIGEE